MRKIALALVLFQLIGCAKYPDVTTHPEKKQEQEQETLQHDTPQTPKTNYLKIGAYIVGTVLAILAIGRVILYCCRQKEEEKVPVTDQKEQAKKIAEERAQQDEQDIDRIVTKTAEELQNNYPNSRDFILHRYGRHPTYKGKVELGAILKWYFLQQPMIDYGERDETNLTLQRELVTMALDKEVKDARNANPEMRMSQLLTNIERSPNCLIASNMTNMTIYERAAKNGTLGVQAAPYIINTIARIVYYYEFKNALIESEK